MEEGSGTLTPVSSTASTAVEQQTSNLFLLSSQKSPDIRDAPPTPTPSLCVPRPTSSRPRDRRSFSSAQKFPVLEPSASPFRRQFDFALLWILQILMLGYLTLIAVKNHVVNAFWAIWYDWHAWPSWGKYMIGRDVSGFKKVPRHVAVILNPRQPRREYDADETIRRALELVTWCACAGISIVTIYEPTGLLRRDIKKIQRLIQKRTDTYWNNSSNRIEVRTPQSALLTDGVALEDRDMEVLIICEEDGRLPIVDLARTLGDMTKQEKLFPEDISIDLIHENLTESLMTEPDLLILFSPRVDLQGFPPWQIRLTEIFHLPDNTKFCYSVFIRALQTFDRAEMRLGR